MTVWLCDCIRGVIVPDPQESLSLAGFEESNYMRQHMAMDREQELKAT